MLDTVSKGSTYQTLSYILFTELRRQMRTIPFLILKSARNGENIKDITLKDTKIQVQLQAIAIATKGKRRMPW